jgi:hypothetical protein
MIMYSLFICVSFKLIYNYVIIFLMKLTVSSAFSDEV